MVPRIQIIRDQTELKGTCYFELLPGEYKDQCWNVGSVFLDEEVFALIEPIVAKHEPTFDHYSFVGIKRATWERIIADFEQLRERARSANCIGDLGDLGYFFSTIKAEFNEEFKANAEALARLLNDLVEWLRVQLREHKCISVLGI